MFKKLLLKLFSEEDLRKELVKRTFINPLDLVYFKPEEIEEMWQKIFNNNQQLSKWTQLRKNQLLSHLLTANNEATKNIIIGAISEWELVERLWQKSWQENNLYNENISAEETKDITSALEKLKEVVIKNSSIDATNKKR